MHRASLKAKKVTELAGVNYERIDDAGLHISFGEERKDPRVLEVDNVVICAGQESVRDLDDVLKEAGVEAGELDAKRAIKQGTELAAKL
ncbi:Probable NADPH dependent 2,4-dienoyl-CoA reductase FadH [Mycobacteroides abscessus subsp. massiliense]|nr:Probable NADPH dependent 2,4-dienoyl-CoA reductase FadH [Mycobacteroides abscessus subsp. massiliense]